MIRHLFRRRNTRPEPSVAGWGAGVAALAALLWGLPVLASGGSPVRPLAPDYVVVGESPDPQGNPMYSPTILRLASGRLVAGYTQASRDFEDYGPGEQVFLTSDDGGLSWQERARGSHLQGRIFRAGTSLYYLATGAGMAARRSDDDGETWSSPVFLTSTSETWQQTPANVWHTRGNVYLAYERRSEVINAWGASVKALILLRANENDDLTNPAAWTFSTELVVADIIPGLRTNELELDYFGVPFFPQDFPNRYPLGNGRSMSPIGWAEPMVVQIMDPNHYWYDPTGRTFHILARGSTGSTGYAGLTKVVENPDGSMHMSLEHAPSGVAMLYLPMPGGHLRFHIVYDETTQLYWLVSSQPTDSMRRIDMLPPERFGLPDNERHRLALHFSKNLVDWCFAGIVDMTSAPREARHYASMDIDGDDLIVLSRSGDARARNAHDGNLITFHRVRNFRDLVY